MLSSGKEGKLDLFGVAVDRPQCRTRHCFDPFQGLLAGGVVVRTKGKIPYAGTLQKYSM